MHTRFTLLCFSLAIRTYCFGQGGATIVRPDAPQPGFRPALPNYVKLVEGFAQSVEKNPVWVRTRNNASPAWVRTRNNAGAPPLNLAAPGITCGHIVVIPVSPDVDPKVIVRLPEQSAGKMPIYKGLPACPDDLR
jgi:hypothetical protein